MDTSNRIPKEFKMGLGESGSIDVTRCMADDGSRITMVIRNGHVSINNIPVAVDDNGFVISRDGSLLPKKYQDFYRQATEERNNRMQGELLQIKDVPREHEGMIRWLRRLRRTACAPGPEIGLGDGILPHLKLSREKQRLPREIKRIVNRLTSKIGHLESAVEASMQTTTTSTTTSEPPRRSLPSICNCIHSLRHRRTGALLENEQDVHVDDNLDFVLRTMRDWQSDIGELERGCYKLSKSYSAMQRKVCEAERSNWAMAKTVEAFCAGAICLEKEEAYVIDQYRFLLWCFVKYQTTTKENEVKSKELESTTQKLVERVQELEEQVQELSNIQPGQVNLPACPSSPDNTEQLADASRSTEAMNESEDGIGEIYEEAPTASWFKAFQAHQQHWKGFHDLSHRQIENHKVLHELKVECGSINDQNKQLTSRLGISEINSAKLQDQVRDLLEEKQNLQQRLQTSQTLLQYAQKSLISQPDGLTVGRENVNGQMASYGVSQSENRQVQRDLLIGQIEHHGTSQSEY